MYQNPQNVLFFGTCFIVHTNFITVLWHNCTVRIRYLFGKFSIFIGSFIVHMFFKRFNFNVWFYQFDFIYHYDSFSLISVLFIVFLIVVCFALILLAVLNSIFEFPFFIQKGLWFHFWNWHSYDEISHCLLFPAIQSVWLSPLIAQWHRITSTIFNCSF